MDIKKIRKDFPILEQITGENPLVFLDSGASAQKPQPVIDAVTRYYEKEHSNVHRGLYGLSERATAAYQNVREKVAKLINAADASEIVFTRGTTESINLVASSWALEQLKPGDEILLTQAEHHANLLPWQRIAKKTGAILKFIPINTKTFVLEADPKLITPKTKLMAVTACSNVLGDIWPHEGEQHATLDSMIKKAHESGAKVLLDSAHAVGHQAYDIQKLNVDFAAFSSHKMYGPTGVGVLYIKKSLHKEMAPYQLGGSMVYEVHLDKATWADIPERFEAGTPNIAGVIGLGAAVDYITENITFEELEKHYGALATKLIAGLEKIDSVKIYGNTERLKKNGHLVCFTVEGIHGHDVAAYLASKNVALRAGHHCAQPLVNHFLNVDALIRPSFGVYTNTSDIEILLKHVADAITFLKK